MAEALKPNPLNIPHSPQEIVQFYNEQVIMLRSCLTMKELGLPAPKKFLGEEQYRSTEALWGNTFAGFKGTLKIGYHSTARQFMEDLLAETAPEIYMDTKADPKDEVRMMEASGPFRSYFQALATLAFLENKRHVSFTKINVKFGGDELGQLDRQNTIWENTTRVDEVWDIFLKLYATALNIFLYPGEIHKDSVLRLSHFYAMGVKLSQLRETVADTKNERAALEQEWRGKSSDEL